MPDLKQRFRSSSVAFCTNINIVFEWFTVKISHTKEKEQKSTHNDNLGLDEHGCH